MTKRKKPRDFWISLSKHGETDEIYPCEIKRDDIIHVREVIPGITDTDRLNWMVENEQLVKTCRSGYRYGVLGQFYHFKDPREAIDDAMAEDKK